MTEPGFQLTSWASSQLLEEVVLVDVVETALELDVAFDVEEVVVLIVELECRAPRANTTGMVARSSIATTVNATAANVPLSDFNGQPWSSGALSP